MKLIIFYTEKNNGEDIVWAFTEEKHEVAYYTRPLSPWDMGEERNKCEDEIYDKIKDLGFDGAFSWNYFPAVSNVCEKLGIPYISWLFDSPLLHVYSDTMMNSCNYIFAFDGISAADIKAKGATNCYHLPLAVNTLRLSGLEITDADIQKYKRDISFVGSLYQSNPYNDAGDRIPDVVKEYCEKLFLLQLGDWKTNIMYTDYNPDLLKILKNLVPIFNLEEFPYISEEYVYIGFFLARKYAELERPYILNHLAENFNVTLYNSADDRSVLRNVECLDAAEYSETAPKVYYSSRINLNMSLRSIETGIPLRVFDIMGAGGFMLTNYQKEVYDYFTPGKDIEVFSCMEELDDKVRFYLNNEKARLILGMNGYKRVCAEHTMAQRVHTIMEKVFGIH